MKISLKASLLATLSLISVSAMAGAAAPRYHCEIREAGSAVKFDVPVFGLEVTAAELVVLSPSVAYPGLFDRFTGPVQPDSSTDQVVRYGNFAYYDTEWATYLDVPTGFLGGAASGMVHLRADAQDADQTYLCKKL